MAPAATTCFFFLFPFLLLLGLSRAATFEIANNCNYTVWAAAVPGGGCQIDQGQAWVISVDPSPKGGRVWARTGCSFDSSCRGTCQTGDCGGVLQCQDYGLAPNTLAEFALNQSDNLDFYDISTIDGFNVPMDFSPTTGGCRGVRCGGDIVGQCPDELKVPGGCNGPCPVFRTNEYCCTNPSEPCEPTDYSRFFEDYCPDTYSFPKDRLRRTFTCPGGTNYGVTFCPGGEDSSTGGEDSSGHPHQDA